MTRSSKAVRGNDKPTGEDPKKPPKRSKPTKAQVDAFLKAHGHKAADVNKQKGADVMTDLLALHKITAEQYKAAAPTAVSAVTKA
ncbi:MAG: hypothetical protein NTU85_03465 [Candidatus Kaiserbacteria bacterium]|nr:hypothetical protein [Candidatus Kaiserbacteria bacterium]